MKCLRYIGDVLVDGNQVIVRDGETLVEIVVETACLDRDGRPTRLPARFLDSLDGYAFGAPPHLEQS